MEKGKFGKKQKLVLTLLTVGGVGLYNPLLSQARETTEEKWDQYHSVQISPEFLSGRFTADREAIDISPNNHLVFKNDFLKVTGFSGEGDSAAPASIDGFSVFKNLEFMSFEGGQVSDFRPIRNLKNVTEFYMSGSNNNTLTDFKDWEKIESFDYYEVENNKNRIALTDLSALSNKKSLKRIRISTLGSLPTIRLSKKHNRYELFDPIILSDQFKAQTKYTGISFEFDEEFEDEQNEAVDFSSNVSEDGLMCWENIPTHATSLKFIAKATEYPSQNSIEYYGEINIPIHWVD